MFRKLILGLLIFLPALALAQDRLTLEQCYELAIAHHPLGEKQALMRSIHDRELDNLHSARLPQFNLFALAGIQSETIEFPFENPGIPRLDLPLYKAVAGVQIQYAIYDGGYKQAQETLKRADLEAELFEVDVQLDALKKQVNQLFFGLQLQRAKSEVLRLNLETLQEQIRRQEVRRANGVALPGQVKTLRVRALELEAAIKEADLQKEALAGTLERLIGAPVEPDVRLENPVLPAFEFSDAIDRPEKRLLELERERILARADLVNAGRKPVVAIGGTAGAGYPNQLNLFDVSFQPYALAEVQMNWAITDWGKTKKEREILNLRSRIAENQKAVFDYQVDLEEDQYRRAIASLEARLVSDRKILELQEEVLEEVSYQLDNGVVTSTEFIDQLNKQLEALLQQQIHEIQLMQRRIDYLTHKGLF